MVDGDIPVDIRFDRLVPIVIGHIFIDTDLDEFEEEQLSDTEIKKINARLKNKLGSGTGGSTAKALSTLGKAAIIVIGFMAVGGGVYAAAQYRKN